MPHIDYKFKSVIRDGRTTKATVSFYEGDITTEEEEKGGKKEMVMRYRRKSLIETQLFEFDGDISDEQLRKNLNKEIKGKAGARTIIPEQLDAAI